MRTFFYWAFIFMALVHEPVSTNKLETIDNSRAAYPFQKDDQIGASYATNLGFDQAVVWFTMVGVDGGWLGNGIRVRSRLPACSSKQGTENR